MKARTGLAYQVVDVPENVAGCCRPRERKSLRFISSQLGYLLLAVSLTPLAFGQVATGTPPFSSVTASSFDVVDNANLDVHFGIPVFSRSGTMPFSYALTYDSSVWFPFGAGDLSAWNPVTNWGWRGVSEAQGGYVSYATYQQRCLDQNDQWTSYTIYWQ
jgi:hypothetical protein